MKKSTCSDSKGTTPLGAGPREVPRRTPGGGRASKGFTLLEVIAALAVISIALVALLRSQGQAIQATAVCQNLTTATMLAQHKMADLEYKIRNNLIFDAQGDFEEDGFPEYRYQVDVLPYTQFMDLMGGLIESASGMAGMDGAAMGGLDLSGMGGMGDMGGMMPGGESPIQQIDLTITWNANLKARTVGNESYRLTTLTLVNTQMAMGSMEQ